MRGLAVLLSLPLLLAPGCLEGDDEPEPVADDVPGPTADAMAPHRMHWEGSFTVAADQGRPGGTPCGTLSSCDMRPFTIEGTFDIEATLTWGLPANDFDLYLYRDGTEVSRDGVDGMQDPGTMQVLRHQDLPPGDYELWVVGSTMVYDSYWLDAEFS